MFLLHFEVFRVKRKGSGLCMGMDHHDALPCGILSTGQVDITGDFDSGGPSLSRAHHMTSAFNLVIYAELG